MNRVYHITAVVHTYRARVYIDRYNHGHNMRDCSPEQASQLRQALPDRGNLTDFAWGWDWHAYRTEPA